MHSPCCCKSAGCLSGVTFFFSHQATRHVADVRRLILIQQTRPKADWGRASLGACAATCAHIIFDCSQYIFIPLYHFCFFSFLLLNSYIKPQLSKGLLRLPHVLSGEHSIVWIKGRKKAQKNIQKDRPLKTTMNLKVNSFFRFQRDLTMSSGAQVSFLSEVLYPYVNLQHVKMHTLVHFSKCFRVCWLW